MQRQFTRTATGFELMNKGAIPNLSPKMSATKMVRLVARPLLNTCHRAAPLHEGSHVVLRGSRFCELQCADANASRQTL
jgi:hypothetical protein